MLRYTTKITMSCLTISEYEGQGATPKVAVISGKEIILTQQSHGPPREGHHLLNESTRRLVAGKSSFSVLEGFPAPEDEESAALKMIHALKDSPRLLGRLRTVSPSKKT